MAEYDLDKIAKRVIKIYDDTGYWPEYVGMPEHEYMKDYEWHLEPDGGMPTSFKVKVQRVTDPVIYYAIPLHNVKKEKLQPPNYRNHTCGGCAHFTQPLGHGTCLKYDRLVDNYRVCDDWSG